MVSEDDCDARCRTEYATRFLGETEAIDGVPEETPGFWKPGLVPGVRTLIETQIAAREEYVGPPIDILRITPKRFEWIERKPLCDAL